VPLYQSGDFELVFWMLFEQNELLVEHVPFWPTLAFNFGPVLINFTGKEKLLAFVLLSELNFTVDSYFDNHKFFVILLSADVRASF